MREIKFRAWDKRINKMADFVLEPSLMFGERGSIWEIEQGRSIDFILMQYTGLRDKRGKDIYEGDIVHVKSFDPGGPGGTGRVVFDGGEYALVDSEETFIWLSNNADSSLGYTSNNEREVIGNIYENPELLK